MGLLGQVLTGVVASRMGRGGFGGGGFGGGFGGGGLGGPLGGALGGAVLGGMGRGRGSPVMKALLLLLAAKAAHGYIQRRGDGGAGGGLLGGVAGGGGLGALVEQFTRTGHGDVVNSWIGTGANRTLPPNQLAEALGPDTVQALEAETGMDRQALLQELSETLPEAVDQLTPEGAAPDPRLLAGDDDDLEALAAGSPERGPA